MRRIAIALIVIGLVAPTGLVAATHDDDDPDNDDEEVPECHYDSPVDNQCEETCNDDGVPFHQTRCQVLDEFEEAYWCTLVNVDEAPETVEHLVNSVLEEVYPLVRHAKCEVVNGTQDNAEWWNNDMRDWQRDWWCWAWGGEAMCPSDPRGSVLFWILNEAFGCPDDWDCPESMPAPPSVVPPPPPFP